MATKTFIQGKINTNLADASDILPSEHREVEDLLLAEHFPDAIKVEWDGDAAIDPVTDIIVNPLIDSGHDISFKVYFWKNGNTVYFNGYVRNLSTTSATYISKLITFPTTLYKPLSTSRVKTPVISFYNQVMKQNTDVSEYGLAIMTGLPADPTNNPFLVYCFNGFYKVVN